MHLSMFIFLGFTEKNDHRGSEGRIVVLKEFNNFHVNEFLFPF